MEVKKTIAYFQVMCLVAGIHGSSSRGSRVEKSPQTSPAAGGIPRRQARHRRSIVTLYQMISCATSCEPLSYKGYGCFCGFMGDGYPVDGIDQCCQEHDNCYSQAPSCTSGMHYFTIYDFICNDGDPICMGGRGVFGRSIDCGRHLCTCDLAFVHCLKRYRCPKSRPVCRQSPWRKLLDHGPAGYNLAIVLQTLF